MPVFQVPVPAMDPTGVPQWDLVDNNSGQDTVMWYTQGLITDRSQEHLGLSDKGVILFRKLLRESVEQVERGEDPMNVIRDPAENVCIELPVERAKFGTGRYRPGETRTGSVSKYSQLLREAESVATEAAGAPVGQGSHGLGLVQASPSQKQGGAAPVSRGY